ncbi:transporter substrate-binding domain-containing protein [Actinomadura macra]|uniref:transporter substrate-binding domain-containing protein n=1 Tax=Actinomadura macra TaxID=46164 RepID=UPI0008316DF2|nr:transporter substrate-binding domain-containing protein [Actinomadura macra]
MRRTLSGLLVLLLAGCSSAAEQPDTILRDRLTVGVANDGPGFASGTTNLAGFDIDLTKFLAESLGLPYAPTILTSRDRTGFLKGKSANLVISSFSITKERNEAGIDFAGPYVVSDQALLVRADDHRIVDLKSVRKKSVCTVGSTTGSEVKIPGARMATQRPKTTECVAEMDKRNTDAVFNDTLILYGFMQANPNRYRVVLPGTFGQLQYYGVGFLAGHHDDCLKLNEKIRVFLRDKWRNVFLAQLPLAAKAYTGADPNTGDFESMFKPKEADMTSLSCKL